MNNGLSIVLSNIDIVDSDKSINITRKIYIECCCDGLDHIGRITLNREILKNDSDYLMCSMWIENNASLYIKMPFYPNKDGINKFVIPFQKIKWKFFEFIRRIKLALSIIFKDNINLKIDWEIMNEAIPELADAIKKSFEEINSIKFEGENNV
jgi:hypothetical protein